MLLRAVRKQGRVVDFTRVVVDDAAARLLQFDHLFLLGRGLRASVGEQVGNPVLIDRYRRVLESGDTQSFEQLHLVEGRHEVIVHRVARLGDGVEVNLDNRRTARPGCALLAPEATRHAAFAPGMSP